MNGPLDWTPPFDLNGTTIRRRARKLSSAIVREALFVYVS